MPQSMGNDPGCNQRTPLRGVLDERAYLNFGLKQFFYHL